VQRLLDEVVAAADESTDPVTEPETLAGLFEAMASILRNGAAVTNRDEVRAPAGRS